MSAEAYFKNLKLFGNLYFQLACTTYDELPVLFICSDQNDSLYLCFDGSPYNRHLSSWYITPITLNQLSQMAHHQLGAFAVYALPTPCIKVDYDGETETSYLVDASRYLYRLSPTDNTALVADEEDEPKLLDFISQWESKIV